MMGASEDGERTKEVVELLKEEQPHDAHHSSSTDARYGNLRYFKGVSCGTLFDEMWLCYSPLHQFNSLYRFGELDSCEGKFERWYDCLMSTTSGKFAAAAKERERERLKEASQPFWEIRSKEEAEQFWKNQYQPMKDGKSS